MKGDPLLEPVLPVPAFLAIIHPKDQLNRFLLGIAGIETEHLPAASIHLAKGRHQARICRGVKLKKQGALPVGCALPGEALKGVAAPIKFVQIGVGFRIHKQDPFAEGQGRNKQGRKRPAPAQALREA